MIRCEVVLTEKFTKNGLGHSYYAIEENHLCYGQMSLVNFQVDKPYSQSWSYLESLEICKSRRGQGLGTEAINWLNMKIIANKCHGALINGIIDKGYCNFYRNNGWREYEKGSIWMFYNSEVLSKFCLRSITEIITKNIYLRN